jgi:hypothetical protein
MWDDRSSKRNPKAPDFKCRNRPKMRGGPGCEGVIWPPRDGAASPYPGADAPSRPRAAAGAPPSAPPRDTAPPPDDRDFDPGFGGPDDDDLPF